MGVAHEYAAEVLHRTRVPMEPAGFEPDWDDQPREHLLLAGVERFPLPPWQVAAEATVERGLHGPGGDRPFTLPLLGGMLQDSYGLVGRRLGVHANVNLPSMPSYPLAQWSRGTASGGGLYPVRVYWAAGPSGPLTPGVYHYSAPHHAMQRLLTGDCSAEVRAAVGGGLPEDADQFLILGVTFWRNTFKYNSFGYHVVTMDVGALLQTWRMWGRAQGLRIGSALWFDEPRLSRLLGAEEEKEGLFAVVPLTWETPKHSSLPAAVPSAAREPSAARVRVAEQQRSRSVRSFGTIRRMHAATLADAARRPAQDALAEALPRTVPAGGGRIDLPAPLPLDAPVDAALRTRRSSFGRFSGHRPLTADRLSAMLAAAASGARLGGDLDASHDAALTRLYVCVNHVESVPPGSYAYDSGREGQGPSLRLVRPGAPGSFVQRAYSMGNYNVEQAAAVIVPAVRVPALLDAVGDRGYRLANAAVGATAQAVYTAAAAADIGCGVALAFDGVSYVEELGLQDTGETPLLIIQVGNERARPADFRYRTA
jgi:SagB-type dehydrogenase family enzyme